MKKAPKEVTQDIKLWIKMIYQIIPENLISRGARPGTGCSFHDYRVTLYRILNLSMSDIPIKDRPYLIYGHRVNAALMERLVCAAVCALGSFSRRGGGSLGGLQGYDRLIWVCI